MQSNIDDIRKKRIFWELSIEVQDREERRGSGKQGIDTHDQQVIFLPSGGALIIIINQLFRKCQLQTHVRYFATILQFSGIKIMCS